MHVSHAKVPAGCVHWDVNLSTGGADLGKLGLTEAAECNVAKNCGIFCSTASHGNI